MFSQKGRADPLPSSWTIKLYKSKNGPIEKLLQGYRDFNITQFEVSYNKEDWLGQGFTHYEVVPVYVPLEMARRSGVKYMPYHQPNGEEGRY